MYQSWSHSFLVKVRTIIKTNAGKKLFCATIFTVAQNISSENG
ncbi:hypothetical protein HMPREF0880_03629 [Yokenella regensburgei ATCC 43003]|nr:hypothetical protein HMPREF0880_03629 [Yokenella regensburgei ATCC 43003]